MHFIKASLLGLVVLTVTTSALPIDQFDGKGGYVNPAAQNDVQNGLKANAGVQQKEDASLQQVSDKESKYGDNPGFQPAKQQLQGNIDEGIDITKGTQQAAAQTGNEELGKGLQQESQSQQQAKQLANNLSGQVDHDKGTLDGLSNEFQNGKQQNSKNFQATGGQG